MENNIFDHEKGDFDFSLPKNNNVTFYLHKGKQGFSMEILKKDRKKLEKILNDNNIKHVIEEGNELPF